jgi:hypothetical protein
VRGVTDALVLPIKDGCHAAASRKPSETLAQTKDNLSVFDLSRQLSNLRPHALHGAHGRCEIVENLQHLYISIRIWARVSNELTIEPEASSYTGVPPMSTDTAASIRGVSHTLLQL